MEIEITEPQPATLYIFSDGRFEDVKGFSLGNLQPYYIPIGSLDAKNLAITAFSTRRGEARPEERQAFVQVTNFTDAALSPIVEIQLDGEFLDAKQVDVPAGESSGLVFPLADAPPGKLSARLKYELETPTKRDALDQDDVGYAALNEAKPGRVLIVTPGNVALEVALATERAGRLANIQFQTPDFLASEEYKRDTEAGVYDLVIYDQCAPTTMPRADTLFIGRLAPVPSWHGAEDQSGGQTAEQANPQANQSDSNVPRPETTLAPDIIDWDRAHPLFSSVELGNVEIVDSLVLDPPPGATVLIDSTAGPIAAIAPRDAYQDVVLGFEIFGTDKDGSRTVNTNWPRRLSFPTFCLNALEFLAGGTEDSQLSSVPPGRSVELRPAGNTPTLTVIGPTGKEFTIQRTGEDIFQFHDTNRLGVYDVRRGDQVIERFAVNLFDRKESDVRLRPSQDAEGSTIRPADIRIGNIDVAATVGRAPTRKEAWKLVLACALFVLVFEWYIYNRRVYL
jgi:hypothetical protein